MNRFINPSRVAGCLAFALITGIAGPARNAGAQEPRPELEEGLGRVLASMRYYPERGTPETPRFDQETPRLSFGPNGWLRHLSATPGHAFLPQRAGSGQPEEIARFFVQDNRQLLGILSSNVDVTPLLTRQSPTRTYVRLQQTYAGLPVFGGQLVVQVNNGQGVEFMSADISPALEAFDTQANWTKPAIGASEVTAIVSDQVKAVSGARFVTTVPELFVFDPAVLDETGPVQLVWKLEVDSEEEPELNERWLVNAATGEVARRYPLTHSALNRAIRDSSNTTAWPGTLVRAEGDPATGTADVDNAYTFLGQAYNFFQNNHGRDSFNDAGATIHATVRYCPAVTNCPWSNAQWTGSRIRFGNGFTTDDVAAHEFGHAVTDFTSGLIYANASGAINESLSDIWGEFVDLTNAAGTDTAGVRWDMGEDLPNGRIRSMSDPPARNDPDRLGSPLYVPATNDPNGTNDFGGVHTNSGVNNKLAFLLVDGDTFNGQIVDGMGINTVADLYYEANANILTSGANWTDLFEALRQAALNLGWSAAQRNNLYRACRAVEIAAPDNLYVDWSCNALVKTGMQFCLGIVGPYQTVTQGVVGAHPGDRLFIRGGSYDETVTFSEITTVRAYNGNVVIGQ